MSTFRQVIYVIEISHAYCDLVKTTELYVVILGIEIKRTTFQSLTVVIPV